MIRIFFILILLTWCSVSSLAQKKSELELPKGETIASYTAWIKEALIKFSFYESNRAGGSETTKITDIKFQNCAIKLRVSKVIKRADSPVDYGRQTRVSAPVGFDTHYVFDFGQIDAENIALRRSLQKNMTDIILSAVGLQPVVHFVSYPNTLSEEAGKRSSITLTVQTAVSLKIKEGTRALIGHCKERKDS